MAMGWFGLRAVLVRIACMCPNEWAKQEKKIQGVTEATLVTMPNMIKFYSSYTNYSGYSLYLWWVLDSEYFGKFVRIFFHYFKIKKKNSTFAVDKYTKTAPTI